MGRQMTTPVAMLIFLSFLFMMQCREFHSLRPESQCTGSLRKKPNCLDDSKG